MCRTSAGARPAYKPRMPSRRISSAASLTAPFGFGPDDFGLELAAASSPCITGSRGVSCRGEAGAPGAGLGCPGGVPDDRASQGAFSSCAAINHTTFLAPAQPSNAARLQATMVAIVPSLQMRAHLKLQSGFQQVYRICHPFSNHRGRTCQAKLQCPAPKRLLRLFALHTCGVDDILSR